jgi:hypothetical protein
MEDGHFAPELVGAFPDACRRTLPVESDRVGLMIGIDLMSVMLFHYIFARKPLLIYHL